MRRWGNEGVARTKGTLGGICPDGPNHPRTAPTSDRPPSSGHVWQHAMGDGIPQLGYPRPRKSRTSDAIAFVPAVLAYWRRPDMRVAPLYLLVMFRRRAEVRKKAASHG